MAITLLGATLTVLTRGGHPTVALVHDEEIGVRPPAEWQSQARWRTPPLLKDAGRVLMIDGTRMAFVTKDRTIALTDVGAGTVLWSGRYPDGEPHTGLGAGRVDGRRVVVAHVGNRLAWWDLESGTAQEVSLPDGASVNLHGSTPLVVGAGARTAGVVRDGRLRTLPVPAGATPLAARDDGTVTAAGPAGWWHLSPDTRADQPTPWENPRAAGAPTIVAYVDGSILSILPAGTGGTAYLAVYSDRTDDVRFAWGGSAWFDGAAADWYPSPSRRWGIFGRTLVDLANARSVDLGSWTTQLVGPDRAVGMLARQRVLVGPTLPSGAVPDDEAVPEDIATTAAAVRAKDGDEEVVYLLPPKAA